MPTMFTIASDASADEHASSIAPDTAAASPMKGLAQRLPAPTSPGLLELSLAPEELVLVPSNTAGSGVVFHSVAATALPPSQPPFPPRSSQSISSDRACSLPAQGASSSAAAHRTFGVCTGPLSSPRRAISAQPPPSPRRVPLPAKRELSSTSSAAAVFGSTSRITAVPHAGEAAARPPPSPRRAPAGAVQCSTATQSEPQPASNIAGGASLPSTLPESSARMGKRTANASSGSLSTNTPQADGQAKHRALPVRVSARRVAALVPKAEADASAAPAYRAPPSLTPAQLGALTTKNTSFNKQHYNKHNVTVIHRDENRPPSPTSKIRKSMDSGATATLKAGASGSKQPVYAVATSFVPSGSSAVMDAGLSDLLAGAKRPHYQGAGDEGTYTSPVKSSASEGDADRVCGDGMAPPRPKRPRTVKWDRDLLAGVAEARTPRRAKARAAELLKQNKVYKVSDASEQPVAKIG